MNDYIELLKKLISTPSVSGDEKGVADIVETFLLGHGHEVKRLYNNIWVESQAETTGRPTILLNAHLDTVRPAAGYTRDPYTPVEEGDTIYGLGSNDDLGSLVGLLAAYEELSSREQPYRLIFSATAGEENCAPDGIESVIDKFGNVSLGIIGEPTGMQMAVAEKGLMVLDCKASGKSGHAARSEGVNALYKAVDDINWFRTYAFDKVSPYLGPVKMSVTMIQAGSQHNVVPDSCSFVVDVRPNGEYTNQQILDIIKQHVGCEVTPRSLKHNSSSIAASHPVVIRGTSLGLESFGSPTTSNQTRCFFPTLKIGPGQSSRSHTADEFILKSEIYQAIDLYIKLLDGLQL